MCQRIDCPKCGQPTYAGCGLHIEQVLGSVPVAERCKCRETDAQEPRRGATEKGSWLKTLLGK
jgi:hypothetical protein